MEWAVIARTVWAHRRKVYAALAVMAPFFLTMLMVVFVLFAAGGGGTGPARAVMTPQCQQQLQSQGISADTGASFGPGPVNNGKAVIAAGIRMNIPEKGIIVALATALQESGLRNLANPNVPASMAIPHEGVGHDHLSVGIMQQQPWWGNLRDLMTPAVAAQKFFSALLKVGGWQNMAPTVAAQAVQRSAFPDAYADDVAAATVFYRQHLREVMATSGGSAPPDPSGSPPASDDAAGGGRDVCGVVVDPKATTLAPGTPAGTAAAKFAQAQIGLPYIWGGGSLEGPTGGGFDCSGLVRYAIFQASGHRIVLPRRTYEMVHVGQIVPRNAVQPGDLVFLNPDSEGPGHVAMVVNPTTIVEAQTFGVPVKLSPFPNRFVVIKRVL
ncbi:NlpC/P60 family protein [Mycobacterium avium subsp. hominissuis]|uniref:C40 family peptidase n=1 Tax=Mycobacterium TaxID=1763 RepID=UPI0002A55AC3|nr:MULTISPECIES: NlpC/P60 family protein [Mycobacterium]AGB27302.1 cell wall-associated hydrolase, invasion-associated protein [Mycobacterium sp. JS623]MDO2394832.1 NlpC/P60 family protein [Mycobacterium avium subsp. hominissuis]